MRNQKKMFENYIRHIYTEAIKYECVEWNVITSSIISALVHIKLLWNFKFVIFFKQNRKKYAPIQCIILLFFLFKVLSIEKLFLNQRNVNCETASVHHSGRRHIYAPFHTTIYIDFIYLFNLVFSACKILFEQETVQNLLIFGNFIVF